MFNISEASQPPINSVMPNVMRQVKTNATTANKAAAMASSVSAVLRLTFAVKKSTITWPRTHCV